LYLLEVEKRKDLERELSVLRTQSRMLPAQLQEQASLVPSSGEEYNSHFQKKMYELEAQVNTLKDERGELYKTQGKNAQRLLDLTEKIQTYETKVNSMEEE
jgi:autophagy-related protein 16